MIVPTHATARCLSALLLGSMLLPAATAQDDPIKAALETAKERYDGEVTRYRVAIKEWLDKQEESARASGNRKGVDQAKADRKEYEDRGRVPLNLPAATKKKYESARSAMEVALVGAVKSYTKAKQDAEASAVSRELDAFRKKVKDEVNAELVQVFESAPAKYLMSRKFEFGTAEKTYSIFTFKAKGEIAGSKHPNESSWTVENNLLVLKDPKGTASTIFTTVVALDGRITLKGRFLLSKQGVIHELREVAKP